MHGPAAGLVLAEEILDGRATTIDIDGLRWGRFEAGVERRRVQRRLTRNTLGRPRLARRDTSYSIAHAAIGRCPPGDKTCSSSATSCTANPPRPVPWSEKFIALSKLSEKMGMGKMRVMTDVSAERYWTVVSEMEVDSLEKFTEMSRKSGEMKEFQEAMKGYHDLVESGRREIYMIES